MKQLLSLVLLSSFAFASYAIPAGPGKLRDCAKVKKSCGPLKELKLVNNQCVCQCKGNLVENRMGHCVKMQ